MAIFAKKKELTPEMPASTVPIQAVISMRERGLNNEQVIDQLKSQGYSLQSIRDALTQAEVKNSAVTPAPIPEMPEMPPIAGPEMPPEPAGIGMPEMPPLPGMEETELASPVRGGPGLNISTSFEAPKPIETGRVEEMERILEEIVDERWKDVTSKFVELESFRARMETRVDELSKRVTELSGRLDEIAGVVMSKVDEYKKTMEDVDIEIKALEKVMQKLVPSMAEQVRDLKDVVGSIKGVKQLE